MKGTWYNKGEYNTKFTTFPGACIGTLKVYQSLGFVSSDIVIRISDYVFTSK